MHVRLLWATSLIALSSAAVSSCDTSPPPDLLPVAPQEIEVSQTLAIALPVRNLGGRPLRYVVTGPMLAGFETVTALSGSPSRGEFRWTPLASHVGIHELTFSITASDGGVYDRERVTVQVTPSADAAPIFASPGPGGSVRDTDPHVRFVLEVRDLDSPSVEIRARSALPEGAELVAEPERKRATFDWELSPDQVAAATFWPLEFEADDGDHDAVPFTYTALILRSGGGSTGECPGDAPSLTLLDPLDGDRVAPMGGYDVRVRVADDMEIRDPPVLHWTTESPESGELDLTTVPIVVFSQEAPGGDVYHARVPSMGLADGMEQQIWFVVTATDNDDATGTNCDHTTESRTSSFVALGGEGGGGLGACQTCTRATDCISSICANTSTGGICLEPCGGSISCATGSCQTLLTVEGALANACGDAATVCGSSGGGSCADDGYEENDTASAPTVMSMPNYTGQICPYDSDFFRIDGHLGNRVTVQLDLTNAEGDLDLRLLGSDGRRILRSSASTTDRETVSYCMDDTGRMYAQVYGYRDAQNDYGMTILQEPAACCIDDSNEPDDSSTSPRRLSGTTFSGTICPGNSDYISFNVAGASALTIDLEFAHVNGDLDMRLYEVGTATVQRASSIGVTDREHIEYDTTAGGTYALRVYGSASTANSYTGSIVIAPITGCDLTRECALGRVCEAGTCASDSCTTTADCPATHLCPTYGVAGTPSHCGQTCSVTAECRTGEACKWFPQGRACAVTGANGLGAGCASASDCSATRACLPWPGGLCTRANCRNQTDCEAGTFCVVVGGQNVCALDCETDIARCDSRDYVCSTAAAPGATGVAHNVCIPPS